MADYTPKQSNGLAPFTLQASGAIGAGNLVTASGQGTVAASTTNDHSIGVAGHDAVSGAKVTVWPIAGVVHRTQIQDSQAATYGTPIIAGTTGYVATGTLATVAAAGTLLGIVLTGGTGSDSTPVYAEWIGLG